MKMVKLPDGESIPDRRGNPSNITFKWLVGVLLTLLFMGGGAWMTSLYAQVSNLQTTSVGHAERLAALESTVKSIDKHMGSMDRNVERILDQLERQASRR